MIRNSRPQSEAQRKERLGKAHDRGDQASAEERALDAAVRQSIKLHGA